jgi:RNA-dependent RNA polymerase
MFGVVDETRSLAYNEVFVQYSAQLTEPNAQILPHIGPVLVSKNPMMVGGDVRVFDAVYRPQLRTMVDVIVFPATGSRPLPNQIAGSDLDGDEYVVIFDTNLIFKHNERPLCYTPAKLTETSPEERCPMFRNTDDAAQFFVRQMNENIIGQFGNRHLGLSDLFGVRSRKSGLVAIKSSQMVDFPKSGILPAPLGRDEGLPMWPDFMEKHDHSLTYPSHRLIGQLYR